MLTINFKQIYETNEKVDKEWVLIIYDISANHYVGMPVYSKEKEGCIYEKGKPVKLSRKDFNNVLQESKNSLIQFLNKNIKNNIDGISYIKWCRDKFVINQKDVETDKLIQKAIYWVDFGVGVGSELRKLRPAILWGPTSDKNLWTMIPLTTKRRAR